MEPAKKQWSFVNGKITLDMPENNDSGLIYNKMSFTWWQAYAHDKYVTRFIDISFTNIGEINTSTARTIHEDVGDVKIQARHDTFKHFEVLSKPRHLKNEARRNLSTDTQHF